MKREHPLKQSIEKRIEEERYVFPKERKRKRKIEFKMQWIVILSVLISLLLILIRLFQFFW